jgi:hypothetical protein
MMAHDGFLDAKVAVESDSTEAKCLFRQSLFLIRNMAKIGFKSLKIMAAALLHLDLPILFLPHALFPHRLPNKYQNL